MEYTIVENGFSIYSLLLPAIRIPYGFWLDIELSAQFSNKFLCPFHLKVRWKRSFIIGNNTDIDRLFSYFVPGKCPIVLKLSG